MLNKNQKSIPKFKGKQGHVYILTNPSIPGQVKIGYTQLDDVVLRSKQLSKDTGVPTPFIVYASRIFDNCMLAEKMMHSYFSENTDPNLKTGRVSENREFFWTTPELALEYLIKIHKELNKIDKLTDQEIATELGKGIECIKNKNYHEAILILEKLHFSGNYIASYWLGECYTALANSKYIKDPLKQKNYYKAADFYSYAVLFQYRPAYIKAYQAYFYAKLAFKSDIVIDKFCSYIRYNRIKLTDQEKDMILYHLKRNLKNNNKDFYMFNPDNPCWKIYSKSLRKRLKKILKENKKSSDLKEFAKVDKFLYVNKHYGFKFMLTISIIFIIAFFIYIYIYGNKIELSKINYLNNQNENKAVVYNDKKMTDLDNVNNNTNKTTKNKKNNSNNKTKKSH